MGAPYGGGSWTSAPQDTSGASFIVMLIGYEAGTPPVVTDNKGNTWIPRPEHAFGYIGGRWVYAQDANAGTNHTFTFTGVSFASVCIAWYSGIHLTSPFDQELADTITAGTSGQAGSVTPAEDNSLVLAGLASAIDETVSINGGFVIREQIPLLNDYHFGSALADLIQTTATAANPTWSWTTAADAIALIAVFKTTVGVVYLGTVTLTSAGAVAVAGQSALILRSITCAGAGVLGPWTSFDQVYVQARAGIERSGAGRAGYFVPNVIVSLDGAIQ